MVKTLEEYYTEKSLSLEWSIAAMGQNVEECVRQNRVAGEELPLQRQGKTRGNCLVLFDFDE